jgi:hypothetical protein
VRNDEMPLLHGVNSEKELDYYCSTFYVLDYMHECSLRIAQHGAVLGRV